MKKLLIGSDNIKSSDEMEIMSQPTKSTNPPQPSSENIVEEVHPEKTDVLCGRGAPINMHPGNVIYRQVVNYNKPLYQACEKFEKYRVAQSIVEALECRKPSVRFLEQQSASQGIDDHGNNKVWSVISKEKAIRKTIQALRERDRRSSNPKENIGNILSTENNKRKMELDDRNNCTEEGKEDWQVLFRHLLPEAACTFNRSPSLIATNPTQENKRQHLNPVASISKSITGKIKRSTKEEFKMLGKHVSGIVPRKIEKSKKQTLESNLCKQKSLQLMIYDSLSMNVNEIIRCESAEEDNSTSRHHHPDSSLSSSPNSSTIQNHTKVTTKTQSMLIPESISSDKEETSKSSTRSITNNSSKDNHSLLNTNYCADVDDAYSIASDLTKHFSTDYSIEECRGNNPFNSKEEEQWIQDIDFCSNR